MIRIVLADDEPVVCETLGVILESEPDLEIVATAGDGAEAIRVVHSLQPDVVVMDLHMPGMDGLTAIRRLSGEPPPVPAILALTTFATDQTAIDAVRAGAGGFCAKADPPDTLINAVRAVAIGDAVVSPLVLGALLERLVAPHAPAGHAGANASATGCGSPDAGQECSPREVELLAILAEGATNKEIAKRLFISEATVRTHLQHLRKKLGARSRTELLIRAYELGLTLGSPSLGRD